MTVIPSGRDDQPQRLGDHGGQTGQTGARVLLGRMLRAAYPLISLAILLLAGCATTQTPILDLKITNGRILDGTGAPWFRGDVGIRGDTIVAVGDLSTQAAATTIDAHGRVVSPGFIDLLGQSQMSVFADPHLEAKVRQGVTTEVTGEGHSPGPLKAPVSENERRGVIPHFTRLADYFSYLEKR